MTSLVLLDSFVGFIGLNEGKTNYIFLNTISKKYKNWMVYG
jgi:hypothetical protein